MLICPMHTPITYPTQPRHSIRHYLVEIPLNPIPVAGKIRVLLLAHVAEARQHLAG